MDPTKWILNRHMLLKRMFPLNHLRVSEMYLSDSAPVKFTTELKLLVKRIDAARLVRPLLTIPNIVNTVEQPGYVTSNNVLELFSTNLLMVPTTMSRVIYPLPKPNKRSLSNGYRVKLGNAPWKELVIRVVEAAPWISLNFSSSINDIAEMNGASQQSIHLNQNVIVPSHFRLSIPKLLAKAQHGALKISAEARLLRRIIGELVVPTSTRPAFHEPVLVSGAIRTRGRSSPATPSTLQVIVLDETWQAEQELEGKLESPPKIQHGNLLIKVRLPARLIGRSASLVLVEERAEILCGTSSVTKTPEENGTVMFHVDLSRLNITPRDGELPPSAFQIFIEPVDKGGEPYNN